MQRVPVTILDHVQQTGHHYDLLIGDPTLADDPTHAPANARALWAARMNLDSKAWGTWNTFILEQLIHHRRVYLEYEGPIGGGRGAVHQVDSGWARVHTWADSRRLLTMHLRQFTGQLELTRLSSTTWQARPTCRS